MKIQRLPHTTEQIQVPWMSIDGHRFSPPGDFDELIEDLLGCDGFGSAINIYDHDLRKLLIETGLIDYNIRGGCFGTKKLRENKQALLDAFYQEKGER